MALPVTLLRFSFVFTLAAAGAGAADAQSLNQPNPLERLSDVAQFGVPRDTKFVFCDDGDDCPERSIKHLYVPPPPPPPPVQAPVLPASPSITPPDELSHAKVAPTTPPLKKKRKKPTIKYECKPVTKVTK